jgi:hypothetical protein
VPSTLDEAQKIEKVIVTVSKPSKAEKQFSRDDHEHFLIKGPIDQRDPDAQYNCAESNKTKHDRKRDFSKPITGRKKPAYGRLVKLGLPRPTLRMRKHSKSPQGLQESLKGEIWEEFSPSK